MRTVFLSVAVAAALVVSGCQQQAQMETIATTEQLMYGMVEPLSTVVFESVATVVDREGIHEIRPGTEEEWEFVRNSALGLAESANLLLLAERPMSEGTPERGDDWAEFADGLKTSALQAADAAQARDPEALFSAGSVIYEQGCLACHDAYAPQEQ